MVSEKTNIKSVGSAPIAASVSTPTPAATSKTTAGFTIIFKISGQDIPLTIADLKAPQPWVFNLVPDQPVTFTANEVITWLDAAAKSIDSNAPSYNIKKLPTALQKLLGDPVTVPTFQVSTAGMINVALNISFTGGLLTELGVPKILTSIIDIESFALALHREPEPSDVESAAFTKPSTSSVVVTVTFTKKVTVNTTAADSAKKISAAAPTLMVQPATGDPITCTAAAMTTPATTVKFTFTGTVPPGAVTLAAQVISVPTGASILDSNNNNPLPLPLIEGGTPDGTVTGSDP